MAKVRRNVGREIPQVSQEELRQLLNQEKKRRGVAQEHLVFLGMANVASYWWCAASAVIASRKREIGFFAAYLEDRLRYSLMLGRIESLPEQQQDWLPVGEELTLADVESLARRPNRIAYGYDLADAEAEEDPIRRGEMVETIVAKKYPTVRWNFPWRQYVLVGVPDGLTKDFVYEFKSTRLDFLLRYRKPVAMTQADLYGYFFQRGRKRVQIHVMEKKETHTFDELVDSAKATRTLESFAAVDSGERPKPPVAWKCKKCEWAKQCKLTGTSGVAHREEPIQGATT